MPTTLQREAELLEGIQRRKIIRDSLIEWAKHVMADEGMAPAKHHLYILRKIEDIVKGRTSRRKLMIFMPPGSGKSTYTSVLFPPWFLAQGRGLDILTCAHKEDLVLDFGRRARNLVEEKHAILGYELSKDSSAADKWNTTDKGVYRATGVGAGISGRRADLFLIEDPIGKKEDADSQLLKDKQWSWYQWDVLKRVKPKAIQILITTRWCEDDLAGRLLEKYPDEWEVINIPLIAEDNDVLGRAKGEPLWPEYFDAELITSRKASEGFMTQEQNNPLPAEGNFFKKEMLKTYHRKDVPMESELRFYLASDHATGVNDAACNSCILVGGLDHNDNLWIMEKNYWDKGNALVQVESGLDLCKHFSPLWWFIEEENISKTFGPFLRKRMIERNIFTATRGLKPTKDVLKRAQSIHGRCSLGKVFFPADAEWWPRAERELLAFPNGKLWDFVSALGLFGMGVEILVGGEQNTPQVDEKLNVPFKLTGRMLHEQHAKARFNTKLALLDH